MNQEELGMNFLFPNLEENQQNIEKLGINLPNLFLNQNYNINYNLDDIKIYNGTLQDNRNKLTEDYNSGCVLCCKKINVPRKMSDKDIENKYLSSNNQREDILENIYLVYELHDDFDNNNIEILIDLLSDTTFKILIGKSVIFDINLSLSCVSENENPILYIQSDILKYQIENSECNINNHQYKELIEECMLIYKKFIIMPISFNKFINTIYIRHIPYNSIEFIYTNINKKLYDFIKSINLSEKTISVFYPNVIYDSYLQDILTLETSTYKLDKSFHQIVTEIPINSIYFTIKISPNYEEIDKNLWSEAIYMFPNINLITYLDKKITSDEMIIRTTKNCHIYFYFIDPNEKLKLKLKCDDPIQRTKDIIKKYISDSINKKDLHHPENVNSESSKTNIKLDIDIPQISINVNISLYVKKKLIYYGGCCGL